MQAPFADPLLGLEQLRTPLPIVGRETELQLLHVLLDTVALDLSTGARAMTISGEMGVGKTRLLAALCQEARERGFRILQAHVYESASLVPYAPFIEALRPVIRSSSPERLRRYLGLRTYSTTPADVNKRASSEAPSSAGPSLLMTLTRLFPELPDLLDVEHSPELRFTEPLSPDQEKFRLLDAVATLLERIALEQPVLLAIDNLQWADSATLELTLYLTMRLRSSRIALVGVTRSPNRSMQGDESAAAAQAMTRMLADLMRQGMLQILLLSPLSMQAATQHLHMLLPGTVPQSIAQPLLSRAEGNPFFLEELVRTLTLNRLLVLQDGVWHSARASSTRLPDSIIQAVGQRLQELSTDCRDLLHVAALFGRTFPLDALAQVLQTDIDAIQPLITEAVQTSLIAILPDPAWNAYDATEGHEESSDAVLSNHDVLSLSSLYARNTPLQHYVFCQGIVQEALYVNVPAYRTRPLHAAIGKALEACYAHEATDYASELAHHYALGGEKEATLRWSLLAGEDAASKHTHREAIGHFRLAVKLLEADDEHRLTSLASIPSLTELYLIIGELWVRLGELTQAVSAFQQALQLLQNTQEASLFLVARANRLLADAYRMQARYDQALAHLQAAATAFNALLSTPASSANDSIQLTYTLWYPGRSFISTTAPTSALEHINTSERILFLQSEAVLKVLLNRSQEAEAALWQSHQLATEIGDRSSQAFALYWLGWTRGWGEHIHEAIRFLNQAIDLYIAIGDVFRATIGDQVLGSIHLTLGDMEQARLYTLRGLERLRRYGVFRHAPWFQWNQGIMALTQGDWENSLSHLQQALQEAIVSDDARLKPLVLQVQATLQFRRGNWQAAEQLFLDSIQSATALEWLPGAIALYGHFLAVTGRLEAARTQLERAAETPEPPGFNGQYYIPFLVEGYMHLNEPERAAAYIERIRKLRGFMYYGTSVDRILGIVAMHMGDWQTAEQAFEDGLALCRHANNQPEEAVILCEQARAALMRNAPVIRILELCQRARAIFLQYDMQRAIAMVDTLREGVSQLDEHPQQFQPLQNGAASSRPQKPASSSNPILHLHLTKRELEVLRLVAEGHTDREVADTLIISPRTANRHLSNIFVKLDVPGRAAAVAYAIRHGLV